METVKRCIAGEHKPAEIRWHLALLAVGYWALVYFAWRGYTAEHAYSVMTHTLSALGSFDERHNPEHFWLFSVAMIYCGATMIPIILYIRRRLMVISELGAWVGSLFFLVGCLAIILTGIFPDAHGKVIGSWEWRQIHMKTAVTIAVGFGTGIIWYGVLLLRDMLTRGTFSESGRLPYLKIMGPFSVLIPVFAAISLRLNWEYAYGALVAAVRSSQEEMKTYWDAAVEGFHSFPILEHLSIWGLTLFVIWFAAVLPYESGDECAAASRSWRGR